MTAVEWLNSERAVSRSKRSYAHFDLRTDLSHKKDYVSDPACVAKHGFYPFIHYTLRSKKFSRKKGKSLKARDICYAAHIDRCIFQYYGFLLNSCYNERVRNDGISSVAVAYRTDLHQNTIHFSKRAFDFIKSTRACYVMIGDYTGFFDHLNHLYLKQQWCSLLGTKRLPADHYAVFKNITAYSWWEMTDLLRLNGLEDTYSGRRELNTRSRVLEPTLFKEHRRSIQKNPNNYGIPQGSPISGILANIYMLDLDRRINEAVQRLGGIYIRYSDDFLIAIPDTPTTCCVEELQKILLLPNSVPNLDLQPDKTQYFYYVDNTLSNIGKSISEAADDSSRTINFLGFSFDGKQVRIRSKTISKYYYRMYRKARGIVKQGGRTRHGKPISCRELYGNYSKKGAKGRQGNFLTYVNRASIIYGPNEPIGKDTDRHLQKIRKVLKQLH